MIKKGSLAVSYLALRQIIGLLGILLPVVCIVGGLIFAKLGVQSSISAYYHTNMRDFFVGLMVCTGLFMLTYGGYDLLDRIISLALAVTALGIAFFPCLGSTEVRVGILQFTPKVANVIHSTSAITFFVLLAFNSYFLFTKTNPEKPMTPQKLHRNVVYRVCGIVIISAAALAALFILLLNSKQEEASKVILIFESIMLLAFGVSWLTKGEAILGDKVQVHQ